MSLNSLAASRVAREVPAVSLEAGLKSDDVIGPREADVQNALSALVEYVPAESVTLCLATISAISVLGVEAITVYLFYGALTPILFALIYAGKRRAAGESRWPGFKLWPWWPMAAATIAFLAWGLAVPEGPLPDTADGNVLGALVAIFVSSLLGVVGRLFAPKPA